MTSLADEPQCLQYANVPTEASPILLARQLTSVPASFTEETQRKMLHHDKLSLRSSSHLPWPAITLAFHLVLGSRYPIQPCSGLDQY